MTFQVQLGKDTASVFLFQELRVRHSLWKAIYHAVREHKVAQVERNQDPKLTASLNLQTYE